MLKKLMILVVEDSDFRFKSIRDALGENVIKRAISVKQAKEALKAVEFDLVMLDHDLSPEHYEDPDKPVPERQPDGSDLTKWIREGAEIKEPRAFFVHSMNYAGSMRMVEDLSERYPGKRISRCMWGYQAAAMIFELLVDLAGG